MKRSGLAVAAGAFLAVSLLGACGSETARSTPDGPESDDAFPESDPVDLVNLWRITGADGEEDPAWLRLDANEMVLWRDCGFLMGSWDATSTMFVAHIYGASGDCDWNTEETRADWLTRVQAYRPADQGWELLDGDHQVVATLTLDGAPEPIPTAVETYAESPEVTDATREWFRPAEPLPDGATPATQADLLGRWIPQEQFETEPYVEFAPDGSWSGSDGCNGGFGRWLIGEAGEMVVADGPTTAVGCEGAPVPGWVAGAATAAIDGEALLLYDRDAALLAELVRD